MHFSILFCVSRLLAVAQAVYRLVDTLDAQTFYDERIFLVGGDPSHGYVDYLDKATVQSKGLVSTADGVLYGS
ncbi:hypothetical protein PAAG_11507 [Paracoccidioides lutzii Pb01]|uniref:Uncharacterized protein n=1 Tax=Paracoccidioides lutzii (strain ATCC MYA-826 / Pb01) TaxID=502779 RepID=A0A0A2VLQ7_PARBA|nr:hypothetical protein PAAG_11507 [Paracoccidioides lutzii Pb01]KGQ01784.1 hypothetical protein PAAG_11507 [Paracoccidioides lutzii Pb01]